MSIVHRLCTAITTVATMLTVALSAPMTVHAQDDVITAEELALAAAPAAPSWDETSGYGAVETSRAAISALLAPGVDPSWDETSGYASVEASRAANAIPATPAAPTLRDGSATSQTALLFTVTGTDFTPGGRVYLAIYDQMSAQLYRTRWITASSPLPVVAGLTGREGAFVHGGTFHETFADLCGVTAMMRAYDLATATCSSWLTVAPTCTSGDNSNPLA